VTLPDVHLADEAVAAFVDDGLSAVARHRAERHLRACPDCDRLVDAQREAKVLLSAAPDPDLPFGLLTRLRDIPMTADLGSGNGLGDDDQVLVLDGAALAFAAAGAPSPRSSDSRSGQSRPGQSRSGESRPAEPEPRPVDSAPRPVRPGSPGGPAARRPRRSGERGGRPRTYPSIRSSHPLSRRRRSIAGALAGLAFGVIASTVSTTAPTTAAPLTPNGGGGPPVSPVVDRTGGTPTLELNTLQVKTLRIGRETDLSPLTQRGR
jgi:Putative zinc-finger